MAFLNATLPATYLFPSSRVGFPSLLEETEPVSSIPEILKPFGVIEMQSEVEPRTEGIR